MAERSGLDAWVESPYFRFKISKGPEFEDG